MNAEEKFSELIKSTEFRAALLRNAPLRDVLERGVEKIVSEKPENIGKAIVDYIFRL